VLLINKFQLRILFEYIDYNSYKYTIIVIGFGMMLLGFSVPQVANRWRSTTLGPVLMAELMAVFYKKMNSNNPIINVPSIIL